ncbi:MAG: hypothetical protein IKV97_04675 [Clostridia bacterium]|nr:hypothetical protein [Clostridia bacterium]
MTDQSTLATFVWVVFLGVCFGAFYAYYHRRLLGDILRTFIAYGADSEQNALTLANIGYGEGIKHTFAKFALRRSSVLRKTIHTVYEEKAPVKKDPDELFAKAPKLPCEQRYYIPEEKRITAEIRYDGKGTTASTLIITVAVFFAVAIIAVSLLPWIIRNYHNLTNFAGSQEETITAEQNEGPESVDGNAPEDTQSTVPNYALPQ